MADFLNGDRRAEYMARENSILNFYEIQRVLAGYDTYIIGRFRQPGLYALGVMNPEDPKAWSGEVTDLVLYFAITPEEYGWLKTDRPRLDELAGRIRSELPKSRFAAGIYIGSAAGERLQERCREMLKSDGLEGDDRFEEWKRFHPFQKMRQPRTPVTDARHELAEFQRNFARETAGELEIREEERRERTLANRLLEQEALFVGMDRNSPGGDWPGLEYVKGNVHLFSAEENAVTAREYYARCHIFDYRIQRVEQSQYPAFFENCEALGVDRFCLDDGIEPVEVRRIYLKPDSEQSWLEEHNQAVRGAMLRSLEVSGQVGKHRGEMQETLKRNLVNCMVTWRCRMLQELGDTLLYVPCALPEDVHERCREDLTFTKQALAKLKEKLNAEKRPQSAITGPHFSGRVISVENPQNGKLPLRLLTDGEERRWLVGFTSRRQCEAFLEKQEQGDTMVVLTFDELLEQVDGLAGMIVDVMALGVQVRATDMAQCVKLRTKEKAEILVKKPVTPEAKEIPAEKPEPIKQSGAELPQEPLVSPAEEPEPAEPPKKQGPLSRLLRWKSRKDEKRGKEG